MGDARPTNISDENVIILPTDDKEVLKGHIKTVMQELTVAIFRTFEVLLDGLSKKTMIESPRGLDDKMNKDQQHRLRIRASSRLAKLTGDLYLMAGAYSAAINVLVGASEDTKVHSDLAWHAAAQEALQLALVLQSEFTLSERKESTAVLWIALPDKLREVAPLYQKTELSILAFEVHRSVAALLDQAGSPAEAAMALCHGWTVHRQLSLPDKLYALTVIIEKIEALGMHRKRAFFLMLLSNMLAVNREESMALVVLSKTFSVYGVDLSGTRGDTVCWNALRKAIIKKAIVLSESHKDHRLMVEYGCAFLGYGEHLENEEQVKMAQTLKRRLKDRIVTGSPIPCLLPILEDIKISVDAPDLWREVAHKGPVPGDSTFIYSPFANVQKQDRIPPSVCIALHDTLLVTLVMDNPFAFPLELAGLKLISSGVSIESEELALTLPAWTRAKPVSIMCSPRKVGRLSISKVEATIFGIRMTIKPKGLSVNLPVIPLQPSLLITGGPASSTLALREGECKEQSLKIRNISGIDVSSIKTTISNEFGEEAAHKSIDDVLFKHAVKPIKSGKNPHAIKAGDDDTLTFVVTGVMGWKSSLISVCYHGGPVDGKTYQRKLECSIRGTVRSGLKVTRVAALPYQLVPSLPNSPISEPDDENVVPDNDGLLTGLDPQLAASNLFLEAPVDPKAKEDDYCLVIVDLENLTQCTFSLVIKAHGEVIGSSRISRGVTKRLVVPMKRLQLTSDEVSKEVPLNSTQLSILRGMDKFEGCIDRTWYWVKKGLLDALRIEWNCEPNLSGHLSMADAIIEGTFLPFLRRREIAISVDAQSSGKVGRPLSVKIAVTSIDDKSGYVLRALPALHISDDEFGVEFDDMLIVDGILQAIYTSGFMHSFELVALAPCRVRLLVHVERRKDHSIHSHAHPVVIDFN